MTQSAVSKLEAGNIDWATLPHAAVSQRLLDFGLVSPVFAGIQVDTNAALKRQNGTLIDGELCDHNCTVSVNGVPTGGSYQCPAAFTVNRGLRPRTMAPGKVILEAIGIVAEALEAVREEFVTKGLSEYAREWQVPSSVTEGMHHILATAPLEVTLFGGSPEIHPDIHEIIRTLKGLGHVVHITMSGRRLIREPQFVEDLLKCPPDVIGLSADDFESPEQVDRIASLSDRALIAEWKTVPKYSGQRQKVYEALYAARLRQRYPREFPPLLFNIAVHSGNAIHIVEIMDRLSHAAPEVILNPFPVQSAFLMEQSARMPEEDLECVEELVDLLIAQHHTIANGLQPRWPIPPRIHFPLLLKAAFDTHRVSPNQLSDCLNGWKFWRCYTSLAAGRYVQLGSSGLPSADGAYAGGYLSCFWNKSVTDPTGPVWEKSWLEVGTYLRKDKQRAAARNHLRCPGCAFPRLMFDCISTEMGMGDDLRESYLSLRKSNLNY
jgi:hypothetical protein